MIFLYEVKSEGVVFHMFISLYVFFGVYTFTKSMYLMFIALPYTWSALCVFPAVQYIYVKSVLHFVFDPYKVTESWTFKTNSTGHNVLALIK